jgi:hypothetical protein
MGCTLATFADHVWLRSWQLVVADDRLLVGSESIDFPRVSLTSVASGQPVESKALFDKHVTLVTVSFQAHGKMQSDAWHAPFLSAFHLTSANPVKHVQVGLRPQSWANSFPWCFLLSLVDPCPASCRVK